MGRPALRVYARKPKETPWAGAPVRPLHTNSWGEANGRHNWAIFSRIALARSYASNTRQLGALATPTWSSSEVLLQPSSYMSFRGTHGAPCDAPMLDFSPTGLPVANVYL